MKVFYYLICILLTSNLFAQNQPDINKLDDAVVIVLVYDHNGNCFGHGSGFFIDSIGTVITNYHVVKDAYSIKIRTNFNNKKEDFELLEIISGNEENDLVKLSVQNPTFTNFPYLNIARAYPQKGDECWAIGTPVDPEYMNTVSKGLVSNIQLSNSKNIIQTNAEITHGSSGGPLLNNQGNVIGVTYAGDPSEDGARASINFAIWIGALNDVYSINKKTLVDSTKIPCELSFYSNDPASGTTYLYVDGVFIGTFLKYFPDGYTPNCSESGTITRYLAPGNHEYLVYFYESKIINKYSVTLFSNECKAIKIENHRKKSIHLTKIVNPEIQTDFYCGDLVIIYYNDTNEISGIIKSFDQSNVVVDSVTVPVSQIQIVVERNPKSGLFKLAGAGLVVGGVALVAGGMYFLVPGILSPSLASLYLIPAGLLADYFGITCIIRGINKLGNKGKQYDIGYQYKLEVFVK